MASSTEPQIHLTMDEADARGMVARPESESMLAVMEACRSVLAAT